MNYTLAEMVFPYGRRIYKTGDLASWMPDGTIKFHGRIDNQVKIRGFRIELSEIENKLLQHEAIREAAVITIENDINDKYICAYLTSDKDINELNLSTYLKRDLPSYMIPSYYIQMDKIPVTPNGKIDRRKLPELHYETENSNYEEPRNETEKVMVEIWKEVLGLEKVGINDNFFETGGHSLKAIILISKIAKEFSKEVTINDLFRMPTISEITEFVKNADKNKFTKIDITSNNGEYEASSAQKRMYMLQQFDKSSTAYNMPTLFKLAGKVDVGKIEFVIRQLIERHEAFRTYFVLEDDDIYQKIEEHITYNLKVRTIDTDISGLRECLIRSFDLSKAPLIRAEIVKNKDKEYLFIDMHHIVSDGVSNDILMNEFVALYDGKKLNVNRLQYKDYARWQNAFSNTEEFMQQKQYWLEQFENQVPVLNMPVDFERNENSDGEGDMITQTINKELTMKLHVLSSETGTTTHMLLLSVFYVLLAKYTGQDDIVIGIPVSGRTHPDLQEIIGVFVNTLALRNRPNGQKRFGDFLEEVKNNTLNAYENQSYQFDDLVNDLGVSRDDSGNPLFDVMFDLSKARQNKELAMNGLSLKPISIESNIAKFDLSIDVIEDVETMDITMSYCVNMYRRETIEYIIEDFVCILEAIVKDKNVLLEDISLVNQNSDSSSDLDLFKEFSF
ncbi:MAG: condensation domain-containing protein [Ruminiclostridium sp.]